MIQTSLTQRSASNQLLPLWNEILVLKRDTSTELFIRSRQKEKNKDSIKKY